MAHLSNRSYLLFICLMSGVSMLSCGGSEPLVTESSVPSMVPLPANENLMVISKTDSGFVTEVSTDVVSEDQEFSNEVRKGSILVQWDDFFPAIDQGIPEELSLRTTTDDEVVEEKNLYEGFRIQIYSGPSPAMADTVSKRFRFWSVRSISGYSPETYTFFKAPYYRVHVGDFHEREKAYDVAQIIKRAFPDAWVVYDRVNPWNVPADSSIIRFQITR